MNKKTYTKPHISFEDFEITSRVASACGDEWLELAHSSWGLFNSAADTCSLDYADGGSDFVGYDEICYHTINVIYGS